jgi:peroxiredoxin
MAIEVGATVPSVPLKMITGDGMQNVTTDELFAGKTVVLFAVPGAFTPTCTDRHLPGYVEHAGAMKEKGADLVACVAVNDPFVMAAWARVQGVGDNVVMLADGNGELARALGLELDASRFGMGTRSRRYGAIIENGVVKVLNVEAGGEVGVSSAETLLAAL